MSLACTNGREGVTLAFQEAPKGSTDSRTLFDAQSAIQDQWIHVPLKGETEWRLASVGGLVAIRARGRESASGLLRVIDDDVSDCGALEWLWRVDQTQAGANLSLKDKEDVAASIFVLFGDPYKLLGPDREAIPALRYVWTGGPEAVGSIIDSPYLPGIVKSIVLRGREARARTWLRERRNPIKDFEAAFGRSPSEPIQGLVLFTDNDQTRENVEAYYVWARMSACRRTSLSAP